ncbi:MAG TPA: pirin family protein [Aggregicoccus sp.]|nr:pirin family protein [Aggregicoccus sp.]
MALHLPSEPPASPGAPPEAVIVAPTRALGDDFQVRRALPTARRRMVGPFVFFDQMGPARFSPGQGLDVRPHPHIGLATVTYLFEGEILHRDSLGSVQRIQPGAVNWMTAGRGIVHSERTAPDVRASGGSLFGIQLWVALPRAHEERAPDFVHTPESALPVLEGEGVHVRVILGAQYGAQSPVQVHSSMFYAAATLQPGARLALPPSHEERAVYVAEGGASVGGEHFEPGALLLFRKGDAVTLAAPPAAPARLLLLGGEPMDGPRHLFWNFVASSPERLRQAKEDWRAGRFPPVPGEQDFIPLPDEPAPVVYP